MNNLARAILLTVAGLSCGTISKAQLASQPNPLVLGVLEDHPGRYVGEPNFRVVRAVFYKHSNEWLSYPTSCKEKDCLKSLTSAYPQEVHWTIAFDGQEVGRVTAATPTDFQFCAGTGCQKITSADPVPTIGKRSKEFSAWHSDIEFRPLVAVSQANVLDPDHWKPFTPAPELLDKLRQQFRARFPSVSNCRNANENKLRVWNYKDKDIAVFSAYLATNSWSLVELGLQGYRCDGPNDDGGAFVGQWYVVRPDGSAEWIGSDMWLVDAGDYDKDGESEVLFSIAGYNRGGYRLFYRHFTRKAEFSFSYH